MKIASSSVNKARQTASRAPAAALTQPALSRAAAGSSSASTASASSSSFSSHWEAVLIYLAGVFPREIMNTWFANIRCVREDENSVVLAVPSDFAAIWIEENYLDLIKKQYAFLLGHPISVALTASSLAKTQSKEAQSGKENEKNDLSSSGPGASSYASIEAAFLPVERTVSPNEATVRMITQHQRTQAQRKIQLNPRYTFENFIVGSSNQLAHAASMAVAQNLARAYNPLFLYGESGLGKTHLLQAIAHTVLEANPQANVMYLSCEKFTNDFLRALETRSLPQFRKTYRQADVLLIDDIQFLADKERTQEEFFHTFNELFESNKQICLTSDRPPSEISKLEARLISRFQWGMMTDIQAPDLETRVVILRRKAALLNAKISDEILAFLAQSITRNVRRMEGALTRVASYSSLMSGTIDQKKVEQLLQDILQEEAQNQLTIEKIQAKIIEYYRLRASDMQSKRRPAGIAFPRQVAMYLSRILTSHSLQEIGEAFGGRDHGTVIHACKAVENMMDQDVSVKRAVELLQAQLGRRG